MPIARWRDDPTPVPHARLDESPKVLVYGEEAKRIAKLTLQYPDIETGGSLFGYWTHSGSPVVALASGPGRGSRHHRTSFYQDEHYLHDLGTELYDQHGMQHIGEWHSHHRLGLNAPSRGDESTILSGMSQRGWPRFVLLVTTIEEPGDGLVLANYFLFSTAHLEPQPLRILSLPGASPFRRADEPTREESLRPPRRIAWRPGPFTPSVRQSVEDSFPDAWFATSEVQSRLARAVRGFSDAGVPCAIKPRENGRVLELVLGDDTLRLEPGFPETPPRSARLDPVTGGRWSAATDLVEWYLRARRPRHGGSVHDADD